MNHNRHGGTGTRLHNIWRGMKQRCFNKNATSYNIYGGRGIRVCLEWRNDFAAFRDWALSGGYASNLTIDRIDNSNDYEPTNCHWITRGENTCKDQAKPVNQYDLEGNLITGHSSLNEAARQTRASIGDIWRACNGKRKTIGGFKWSYA